MKVEVIKGVSHSIELIRGETSVCITPDEAENLIAQLRAVVPVPSEEIEGTPQEVTLIPSNEDEDKAAKYADEQLAGHNRELAESEHTRHFKMGYVCFAGYEIEEAFMDGMLAERERLMKDAVEVKVYYDFENRLAVTANLPKDSPYKFCDKVSVIIIKKEK